MNQYVGSAAWLAILLAIAAPANADIYRCTDEDGNVAYLQLPCPEPAAIEETVDEPQSEEGGEGDVEEPVATPIVESSREPGEALADCRKRYRDQIDAIDLEMRNGFSPEQAGDYKERLRTLTQQLRACG